MLSSNTNCEVTFDKSERTFYPNEAVTGRIKLQFSNEKSLRGIYFKVYGKAYCRWTQGAGQSAQTFTGQQIFVDEKNYLVGDRNSQSTFVPGEYSYNFSTTLPTEIPISLEGANGYVRYKITVGLDRPFRLNRSFDEPFTVVKEVNLNNLPDLKVADA